MVSISDRHLKRGIEALGVALLLLSGLTTNAPNALRFVLPVTLAPGLP